MHVQGWRDADTRRDEHDQAPGEQLEMSANTPLVAARAGEPGDHATRAESEVRAAQGDTALRRPIGVGTAALIACAPAAAVSSTTAVRYEQRFSSLAPLRDRKLRGPLDGRTGHPTRAVAQEPRERNDQGDHAAEKRGRDRAARHGRSEYRDHVAVQEHTKLAKAPHDDEEAHPAAVA